MPFGRGICRHAHVGNAITGLQDELKREATARKSEVTALKGEATARKSEVTALKDEVTALKGNATARKDEVTALKRLVRRPRSLAASPSW